VGLDSFDNPELFVQLLTRIPGTVGGITDFSAVPDTLKFAAEDFESISSDIRAGMLADVCKLPHRRTGKLYVQKVIRNHTSTVNSFQRTLRLLSLANHPTLLSMSFIEGEKPTILTNFMEGGSVDAIVQKGRQDWDDTQRFIVLLGCALGMCALHCRGIVHRNLKPSNVFLVENLEPRVADCGLSKHIDIGFGLNQVMTGVQPA
jgi:serine/threonine protein kinase